MPKVINQVKTETFGKLELIIKGECENCGAEVIKHAKGYDEFCPNCGLWLEWKDYGYAEDE